MEADEQRVANLLGKFDLACFQLREYKNVDEYQHRSLGYASKAAGKTLQLSYSLSFNSDVLVTSLELEHAHRDSFVLMFEIGEIEASCITNRGQYAPLLRKQAIGGRTDAKSSSVLAAGVTQNLRLSLLLRKDFAGCVGEGVGLRKEKGKVALEENVSRVVRHCLKGISVCGYQLGQSTAATQLVALLNTAQDFRHGGRPDQAAETDILVALSLISARRFVQASEILRRSSRFYVEKYQSSKSSLDFARPDRSWLRQEADLSLPSRSLSGGKVLEGGRYLLKAAKVELLLAETINQPSLVGEKLAAYNRASAYASGNSACPELGTRVDYEEAAQSIGPSLLPFLTRVLGDRSEVLQVSALKSIEFFFDTLGCALAGVVPQLLRALVQLYPAVGVPRTQQDPPIRSKLLVDHINHLLQSLLTLLPAMSRPHLRRIFQEAVLPHAEAPLRLQLQLYLLRFGQRALQLCGGDLQLSVGYVRQILGLAQGKLRAEPGPKHLAHNLSFFAQRICEVLKQRVLPTYRRQSRTAICSWVQDSLLSICENQTAANNTQLGHLLDLVIAIFISAPPSLPSPLEPVLYLLNASLHQPKLPFEKLLECFIVLLGWEGRGQGEEEGGLGEEVVERVMGRARVGSLSPRELRLLGRVVGVVGAVRVEWLQEFLACIPHSNHDEVYSVFDLLLRRSLKQLDARRVHLIIEALLNQYTVKGKAHQHSKELFLALVVGEKRLSLPLLMQLCLLDNPEPKPEDYRSRRPQSGHCCDSKLFRLHSELFLQKVGLLLLVLGKGELVGGSFQLLLERKLLLRLHGSVSGLLVGSVNLKLKAKLLVLLKELLTLSQSKLEEGGLGQGERECLLLFLRVVLDILSSFVGLHRNSKLHQQSALCLSLALRQLAQMNSGEVKGNLQFLSVPLAEFKVQAEEWGLMKSAAATQLLRMWPSLAQLLQSPWQNVREAVAFVILDTLREGLSCILPSISQKLVETAIPQLTWLLQSSDHSERLTGVRIVGVLLGLGRQEEGHELRTGAVGVWGRLRAVWKRVVELEEDWQAQIASWSAAIGRVCLGRRQRSSRLDSSVFQLNLAEELQEKRVLSFSGCQQLEMLIGSEDEELPPLSPRALALIENCRNSLPARVSVGEAQSEEQNTAEEYFGGEEGQSEEEASGSEEEALEFEDLGIIDLDDEQWGEEENEVRITQRLPLKKVYKLSPNLGLNAKHHRSSRHRYHSDFQEDPIIVDELQAKPTLAVALPTPPTPLPVPSPPPPPAPAQPEEQVRRPTKKPTKRRKGSSVR